MLAEQEDFLRGLIQEVVQQVLEGEMDKALARRRGSVQRAGGDTVRDITAGRW